MTQTARIDIRARDVDIVGSFTGAQHLFIIFTSSDEREKTIIRGGTKTNRPNAMLKDDLIIIKSPYEEQFKHLFPGDYIVGNPSRTIFPVGDEHATDDQMKMHMDKMWARAEEINAGNYDYKLPIPGCPVDLCHVQNSNTVVSELVKAAGLTLELPVVNGKEVWAPGIDGEFRHTIIDESIDGLNEILDVLDIFSSSEISNPALNNAQRFKLLAQKAKDAGDLVHEEMYINLASQHDMLVSIFGEIENNNKEEI